MNEETIIRALQSKVTEDMDTSENMHYNAGIIDAIEEVKKQYSLETLEKGAKQKKTPESTFM